MSFLFRGYPTYLLYSFILWLIPGLGYPAYFIPWLIPGLGNSVAYSWPWLSSLFFIPWLIPGLGYSVAYSWPWLSSLFYYFFPKRRNDRSFVAVSVVTYLLRFRFLSAASFALPVID